MKIAGSCLCGGVRFTARLPSSFCGHCHCSMCRRSHGAGFVTWFAIPREQFSLDEGEGPATLVRPPRFQVLAFSRSFERKFWASSASRPWWRTNT